jgi:hypothetical protein
VTSWRQHPVFQAMSPAESGGLLVAELLDGIEGLTDEHRTRIADAAEEARTLRAAGLMAQARRTVRDAARAIVDELGPVEPQTRAEPTGTPTEMAAVVPLHPWSDPADDRADSPLALVSSVDRHRY